MQKDYETFVEKLEIGIYEATGIPRENISFEKEGGRFAPVGDRLLVKFAEHDDAWEVCGLYTQELFKSYQNGSPFEEIIKEITDDLNRIKKADIYEKTYVLSHGYYDAYYLKAQKVRRLIAKEFHETFKKVDVIISPVTAGTAYDFGANADPVSAYLSDLYTVPASLAGLPGISVPCGIHSNGRPLGFQLLGETFSEARLLGVAAAWQRETDWHLRRPAGY